MDVLQLSIASYLLSVLSTLQISSELISKILLYVSSFLHSLN